MANDLFFVEKKETKKFDPTKEVPLAGLNVMARPQGNMTVPDYVNLDTSYDVVKKRVTMKSYIETIMSGAK